jgi:uncharacterized Zn-binding protein involved in type VI secretion
VPAVARNGDPMSHGGTVGVITTKTYANGILVVTVGAPYNCPLHAAQTMAVGSATVDAEGSALCRVGDAATCGATVVSGSPDTFSG